MVKKLKIPLETLLIKNKKWQNTNILNYFSMFPYVEHWFETNQANCAR
jgi:hypothetical protein